MFKSLVKIWRAVFLTHRTSLKMKRPSITQNLKIVFPFPFRSNKRLQQTQAQVDEVNLIRSYIISLVKK